MCGISGIISKSNTPISREEIRRITDTVIHRGPDSEGYYHGQNFAFGHRRLAVIDLSISANQPMTYLGKYTLSYNGEIYNYKEIRDLLIKKDYQFKSNSDTEVILAAYDYYGTKCVELFNGMWAFSLFDSTKNIIFCSRDRFGVKPFYYSETHEKFVFGSEIKQLVGYLDKPKVNIPVLLDYLVSGYDDHTGFTFFQNIHKLEQSHSLIYDLSNHVYTKHRYYELKIDLSIANLNERESLSMFSEMFTSSVGLRLNSDVKIGTCLSGGLDSSAIASIASGLYRSVNNDRFVSVTAKSSEPATDESHYAKLVSKHLNLDWNTVMPCETDFRDLLEKVIYIQEEPFSSPSVYMQYKVFEKAKQIGCKVMLDGQGGDETLLGYERYLPSIMLTGGLLKMFSKLLYGGSSGLSKKQLLLYLMYFTNPALRVFQLKKRFSFLNASTLNELDTQFIRRSSETYKNVFELQKLEIEHLQLPHLLKYEDRNSMANSVESRLPFIDYRLVEMALSLNYNFKVRDGWTKFILRKTIEPKLPGEIVWRKNKIGFNAPETTWMKNIFHLIREDLKGSEILGKLVNKNEMLSKLESIDNRALWRLFNISKWERIFNVTNG